MLNSVIMTGRLTADPEMRRTNNETGIASLSIAVQRNFAKQGEDRKTDFFDVTAWDKKADFAERYFRKGQLVTVQGRLETELYDDKVGNRRKAYKIIAESLYFAEPKRDGAEDTQRHDQPQATASFVNGQQDDFTEISMPDEDLPF